MATIRNGPKMMDGDTNLVDGHPIPDLGRLRRLGLPRHLKLDAMHFLKNPPARMPRAAPCLNGSYYMLCEARYALVEGYRHVQQCRTKEPPNEPCAAFCG